MPLISLPWVTLHKHGMRQNLKDGELCRGNLLGVAPATAVFMAVYEPAKKAIATETGSQQQAFLIAAALAGWAASLVRVPTEVVKQRLQAGEFKRPGVAVSTLFSHVFIFACCFTHLFFVMVLQVCTSRQYFLNRGVSGLTESCPLGYTTYRTISKNVFRITGCWNVCPKCRYAHY